MKAIELTKEHKGKLLLMCNKLFPEYKKIEFEHSGMMNLFKQILTPTKNYDYIHWFEFCVIQLAEKLYVDTEEQTHFFYNCLMTEKGVYRSHPIDYLYEQFLKLKL